MNRKQLSILVYACLIMSLMHGVEGAILGSFVQPLANKINASFQSTTAFITFKGISMTVSIPLVAYMYKKINPKIILTITSITYVISLISLSRVNSISSLYLFAIMMGFSSSFFTTILIPKILNDHFNDNIGFALGIALGCSGLSGALFGPVINRMILSQGLEIAFITFAVLNLVFITPLSIFIPSFVKHEELGKQFKLSFKSLYQYDYLLISFTLLCSFVAGLLFSVNSIATSFGFSLVTTSNAAAVVLLGASLFKFMNGFVSDRLSMTFVVVLNVSVSFGGLILVSTHNETLFYVGMFMFGAIVSLMNFAPPLLIRKKYKGSEFDSKLMIISMSTYVGYYGAPYLYSQIFAIKQSYQWVLYTCMTFIIVYISIFKKLSNIKEINY